MTQKMSAVSQNGMTTMTTVFIDESSVLARVIAPDQPLIPPSIAAEIIKWGFPESDKQRMSELAEKARRGTVTEEEKAETEVYERVSSFLGLMKSKTRTSLRSIQSE